MAEIHIKHERIFNTRQELEKILYVNKTLLQEELKLRILHKNKLNAFYYYSIFLLYFYFILFFCFSILRFFTLIFNELYFMYYGLRACKNKKKYEYICIFYYDFFFLLYVYICFTFHYRDTFLKPK